jgi:plasmid stabilization system protein ParE
MAKVIWTEAALNDLKEIVTFILKDSPAYAQRIGDGIMEASGKLDPFPAAGVLCLNFRKKIFAN